MQSPDGVHVNDAPLSNRADEIAAQTELPLLRAVNEQLQRMKEAQGGGVPKIDVSLGYVSTTASLLSFFSFGFLTMVGCLPTLIISPCRGILSPISEKTIASEMAVHGTKMDGDQIRELYQKKKFTEVVELWFPQLVDLNFKEPQGILDPFSSHWFKSQTLDQLWSFLVVVNNVCPPPQVVLSFHSSLHCT